MLRELFFRGSFSVFIWRYETAFRNLDKLQVRSLFRYLIQKRDFLKNFFRQAQKHKLRNGSERMFFEEHWKLLLQLGKGRGYTKHFTISFSVIIIWLLLGSLLQLISGPLQSAWNFSHVQNGNCERMRWSANKPSLCKICYTNTTMMKLGKLYLT